MRTQIRNMKSKDLEKEFENYCKEMGFIIEQSHFEDQGKDTERKYICASNETYFLQFEAI